MVSTVSVSSDQSKFSHMVLYLERFPV